MTGYRFSLHMEHDMASADAQTTRVTYQYNEGHEQLFGFDFEMAPTFSVIGVGNELINWLTKECPVKFTESPADSQCFWYRGGDWDLPMLVYMIRMRWA